MHRLLTLISLLCFMYTLLGVSFVYLSAQVALWSSGHVLLSQVDLITLTPETMS